jgi:hypothetical protein
MQRIATRRRGNLVLRETKPHPAIMPVFSFAMLGQIA